MLFSFTMLGTGHVKGGDTCISSLTNRKGNKEIRHPHNPLKRAVKPNED